MRSAWTHFKRAKENVYIINNCWDHKQIKLPIVKLIMDIATIQRGEAVLLMVSVNNDV
jgi:hypothetical protein